MKTLLTILFTSLLMVGSANGITLEQYEAHAEEMDRANQCFNATGTYSKVVCDIYFRNTK